MVRTEMVKFEPEAMRALVKYKLLKKLIAQCSGKRSKEKEPSKENTESMSPEERNNEANAMKRFYFGRYA